MLNRPRFRPHLYVEVVPEEGVFLLSDARQTLLRGRLYELVSPLLDGRTADDVCQHLRGQASPAAVYYALAQLERKDYLCEQEDALPAGQAALWSSQKVVPGAAAQRLAERPVVVRAFGVDAGPFCESLQSLHVRVAGEGAPDVVLTDNYLRAELEACNAEALHNGRPWLLVKPSGRQVWIGPLFRPGQTGCWECLAQRLQANSPIATYLQGRNGHAGAVVHDRACTPATLQVAWGLAASAVASWVVRGELPDLDGKLQTLDVPSWRLQTHTLIRLPFCPVCGGTDEEVRPFRPPVLESRKKTFTNDGGHRVVAPEVTLARYGYHVSPITGAVPMLERANPLTPAPLPPGAREETGTPLPSGERGKDEGDDGVLHVYVAGNNVARPYHNLAHLRGDLRTLNAGKGTSDVQAKASALCEGLERYSGVFRSDEPRRRARRHELGESAIPLAECLLFSELQYREREARNATGSRFGFIPVPEDPEADLEWSPVWSLTRGEVRYLPTAFCYYDYPQSEERTYCIACSNGNAAGNTLEEAILQGFLELVERDSVALWWYNRVRRPGVDLDSFDEPFLGRLGAFLRRHRRAYWALDLTADLGIPVFASVCRRTDGPPEQIIFGFGAHLEPRVALLRAVTEMNQMLSSPLLAPEGKEFGDPTADPETAHWLATATTANQPHLLPADGPPQTAASYPRAWADDVTEDVRSCQALVERAGLEMLVLDQTRPEVGLPVAKVIVPGLRHFWARFAPGRLYDVPVRLGWLGRPLAEEALNPVPMFLQRPGGRPVSAALLLSWREGVTAAAAGDGALDVQGPGGRVALRRVAPVLLDALRRLGPPGEDEDRLVELVRGGGNGALTRWYYFLERLSRRGLVCRAVHANGTRLATLVAASPLFVARPVQSASGRRYVLSRFAGLRRLGGEAVVESPLAHARVILNDGRAAALVGALTAPATVAELTGRVVGLSADAVAGVLTLLLRAGLLGEVSAGGSCAEDEDPALQTWEFHDLLFHARSRLGRSDAAFGGTYRLAGRVAPPPALKPAPAGETHELYRPDLARLERDDPPLTQVQERRRSVRAFDASRPITDRQLGEFLFRVARVKDCWQTEVATDNGPVRMDFASRPYPAGGGLYELELYAAVNLCANLEPGLHHYDPSRHCLTRLCGRTMEVAGLLRDAAESTAVPEDNVQVLLILAARFPRVAWKYESIAYALTLKHVGVVFQTMYLAATAMGLGPCAVGCGDADLFARAAATDYYTETSVGEFLLGSQRHGPPGPVGST